MGGKFVNVLTSKMAIYLRLSHVTISIAVPGSVVPAAAAELELSGEV